MKVMRSLLAISVGAAALLWLPDRSRAQNPLVQEQEAATAGPELAQVPSGQAVVAYLDGKLTIRARNALLSDILNSVCEKMGAVLDLPSVPDERMFAILGPGRPREVLSSLLSNAQLDFVFVALADDSSALERVMVFPRAKDPTAREQAPQSQVAQNRIAPNPPPSQPEVASPHGGPNVKEMGTQPQIKELLAQVKAEFAHSTDLDPESMRQLEAQIHVAEAAAADPPAIDQQASPEAGASPSPNGPPAGRPRHRRR